ncbi:MAG: antibiotic resistance protein MarC [Desulfurococcales archaeon ex4484_58]|nr:MAG: antibiotic resistance protein MarC [Desulfurococcales archaeon ex4484_58]
MVMLLYNELITSILMLFVVLDAPGNAPLFYFFTRGIDVSKRKYIIRRSVLIAFFILLLFGLIGDLLLKYFHITLDDFRIAGGIILFIYAVLGILGHSPAEEASSEDIAVVPLATPLLAGPGAVTVMIYLKYSYGLLVTCISLITNMFIAWITLENGDKLLNLLGRSGSMVLSKIFAILLAGYSIALIREGILAWINTFNP